MCHSPKLETIQSPPIGEMIKQIVIHPYNELLLSNKKKQITDAGNNRDGSPGTYAEWRLISKVYILCDSIHITFSKWQNDRGGEQLTTDRAGKRVRNYKVAAQGVPLLWQNTSVSWSWRELYPSENVIKCNRIIHKDIAKKMNNAKTGKIWIRAVV